MPELVEAPAGPALVRTKLHPPLRRGEVARPRLLAALTRKPSPRLALLRAPAGAGKTTLLAEWAASPDEQRPFAFLALDAGDNDRFGSGATSSRRCAASRRTLAERPSTSCASPGSGSRTRCSRS